LIELIEKLAAVTLQSNRTVNARRIGIIYAWS